MFLNKTIVLLLITRSIIPSFIHTELLECGSALLFPRTTKHDLLLVFLVNLATNPATVFLDFFFRYNFVSPVVWIIFIEGMVWLVESIIYKFCLNKKTNPFLFSFVLNGASYGLGLLLH